MVADNGWRSPYIGDGAPVVGGLLFAVDLIQDIVEKLLEIMMSSDYYFSLLIHTGTKRGLQQIQGVYRAQEAKVKDMGIQGNPQSYR